MRLAQVDSESGPALVDATGETLSLLEFDGDLTALARSGTDPRTLARGAELPAGTPLIAPVGPGKIVAIGLNYLDHIRETGLPQPAKPLIFSKFPSCIVGPGEAIRFDPGVTERVDWEVELGVVIGRTLRSATPVEAMAAVLGYVTVNDVSARDLQFDDVQWTRGKSLDTFCPVGPYVVTPDGIADVQDLRLTTRVNGELVQDSTTAEMIFGVAEILSFCSTFFTLDPGDLVLTGTPWGGGEFMNPKRSLHDGDVVEVEVEGLGLLRSPVVARRGDS